MLHEMVPKDEKNAKKVFQLGNPTGYVHFYVLRAISVNRQHLSLFEKYIHSYKNISNS